MRIIIFFGIWGRLLKKYYKCHTLRRGEIYLPEVLKMNSRKWIFGSNFFFLRHTEGESEARVILSSSGSAQALRLSQAQSGSNSGSVTQALTQ